MTNATRTWGTFAMLLLCTAALGAQSNGHDDFQRALRKERVDGDCQQAIPLYEQAVRKAQKDRELAANALLQLAECRERLGQEEARKVYQRIVSEYSDQGQAAATARLRLAQLAKPATAPATGSLVVKKIGVRDASGAPSPDGRYMTYANWWTANLGLRDLHSGEERDLTDEGSWGAVSQWAYRSVWSQDSKQIAYSWHIDDVVELRLVGVNGGKPRTLRKSATGNIRPFDFTRDGKHVLALMPLEGNAEALALIPVDGGEPRVVSELRRRPFAASLSPDDRFVVFDQPEEKGSLDRHLVISSIDGKSRHALRSSATDYAPIWLPDNSGFLFASDRGGAPALWFRRVSNGKPEGDPRLVKADLGRMLPLGITKEGKLYLGWASFENAGDIYTASLKDAETPPTPELAVPRYIGSNTSGDLSPDGKRLAYISRRGPLPYGPGSWQMVVRELESGNERVLNTDLFNIDNPRQNPVRWSPDGKWLTVVAAALGKGGGLHLVEVESGKTKFVAEGGGGPRLVHSAWAPDGSRLYFSRIGRVAGSETMEYQIFAYDLAAEQTETVRRGRMFAVSPDGKSLVVAFGGGSGSGLRVVPLAGGEPREILRLAKDEVLAFQTGLVWTAGGEILYGKQCENEGPLQLWRISPDGSNNRFAGIEQESLRDLSVTRDGKLAFTAGSPARMEVWVLENIAPAIRAAR